VRLSLVDYVCDNTLETVYFYNVVLSEFYSMTMQIASPVTGGAQTGFTSPTYTVAVDTPPNAQSRQLAVTAIGGTQAGVDAASSASRPFTVTTSRPPVLRQLAPVDPVTGVLRSIPRNTYKVITRKGVTPLAGQASQVMVITTTIDVPAGADLADAPNVRAALSLHNGSIAQISAGIGDTAVSGVM
jgi:hypothetical protein